jgi:predicted nucleotide-binding protein (sugar kinase/HSP70/actin superfamily)
MVLNSIDNMPPSITEPIYAFSKKSLYNWSKTAGKRITPNSFIIKNAFLKAYEKHLQSAGGINDEGYDINVALLGHPYNLYDSYVNMNLVNKLHDLGIGVETVEFTQSLSIDLEMEQLYKRPFWTYARENYGFASSVLKEKKVEGIIYVSSFNCGTDSVIIELIKNISGNFPFLTLKMDEHTGEAGLNTRIEAFADMLERRVNNESNIPTHG